MEIRIHFSDRRLDQEHPTARSIFFREGPREIVREVRDAEGGQIFGRERGLDLRPICIGDEAACAGPQEALADRRPKVLPLRVRQDKAPPTLREIAGERA